MEIGPPPAIKHPSASLESSLSESALDSVGASDSQPQKTSLEALAELIKSCLKMIVDLFQLSIASNPFVRLLHSAFPQSDEVEQKVEPKTGIQVIREQIEKLQQQIRDCDVGIENGQKKKEGLEVDIKALEGAVPPVEKGQKPIGASNGVRKSGNLLRDVHRNTLKRLKESEGNAAKVERKMENLANSPKKSRSARKDIGPRFQLVELEKNLVGTNKELSQREIIRKTLVSQLQVKQKELETISWRLASHEDMAGFYKEFYSKR